VTELLYRDEVYAIQGAVFEVYREMGAGFLESVYQECLAKEFLAGQVPFVSQQELLLKYKGATLSQTYRPDFVCYDRIIIEIKATKTIAPEHKAQLMNYLSATEKRLGLLVNFGSYPKAQIERIIY
jgi:GxxExxY protein